MSGVLCPRLKSLQIEAIRLAVENSEVMAILKGMVSLRAINGFPLKSFTFISWHPNIKWELIGRDGSFIMKEVVPARAFQLYI